MLPRKLFSFLYALILFIGAGLMPILLADEAYANNTISGTVNENGTLVLTAPQGYKIGGIQFASYGTPVEYQIGECHATTSVAMVQAAISNESLSISASNDVFGDPCAGTGKRLSVILTIEPQVVQRSLAAPSGLQGEIVGTTATVSWSAPAQGNTPVERYAIFWSYDNWASGWAIASTSLSASISGIPAGQQVQIKVRADNDSLAVYSGWSNEIVLQATATPVPSSSPSPAPVEPTPEPSPTPSPTPTEQAPSPSPTPLPSSEPSPSASPEPTSSPSPTVEPSPVPSPSVSPEAEPTSSPTPTPQPTQETQPQPSPTPSPTPSPEPTVDPSVEAARLAEEQRVAAEAARIAAEVEAARQAAIAAEQARQNAIAEQNRIAAEAEAARQAQLAVLAEQQRQAAIEAARIAEEKARAQAEANAKAEAEARAAEEAAAQAEAERIEAEENARIAEEAAKAKEIEDARLEAERIAAEEANAKAEAEAKAAEEAAAKAEADRIAAEEAAAIAETERLAAEEAAAVAEAERIAQEEANAKAEAERLEAEAEAQAQEEANAKAEQERIVAEEKARIQEEADAKAEADAIKAELESKAKAEEAAALAKAKAEETAKAESFVEATGVIPNSPASLPTDKPVLPPQEALKPHIQEDKVGVENGGIQFFGTQSQPQVVGEDGQLTPPPPEPGSGDPIPADAITTEDTFIGQAGGVTFNSPDIAVPVEPIEINIEIPGVGEAAQALANTYVALANVGNDMSPITRKKAKKILLTTIIVGQIVSMRRM